MYSDFAALAAETSNPNTERPTGSTGLAWSVPHVTRRTPRERIGRRTHGSFETIWRSASKRGPHAGSEKMGNREIAGLRKVCKDERTAPLGRIYILRVAVLSAHHVLDRGNDEMNKREVNNLLGVSF